MANQPEQPKPIQYIHIADFALDLIVKANEEEVDDFLIDNFGMNIVTMDEVSPSKKRTAVIENNVIYLYDEDRRGPQAGIYLVDTNGYDQLLKQSIEKFNNYAVERYQSEHPIFSSKVWRSADGIKTESNAFVWGIMWAE